MVWLCGKPLLQSRVTQGFVLLIILVYLQMISLLAVRGVAVLIYQKKTYHHDLEAYHERQQLLIMLEQVDAIKQPHCMIPKTSAAMLAQRSKQWWKKHGCSLEIGNNQAFFVREKLDIDPCEQVTSVYNHLVIPEYYRNTLLYDSGVNVADRLLLQDTVVMQGGTLPACPFAPKRIHPGRQMMRWL